MSLAHLNYEVDMVPVVDPKMQLPSLVVQANINLLETREQGGVVKYGVTLDNAGLSVEQLLQHQLEELLDGANYTQAALQTLRNQKPQPDYLAERDLVINMVRNAVASCEKKAYGSWEVQHAMANMARAIDKAILDYTAGAILRGIPR